MESRFLLSTLALVAVLAAAGCASGPKACQEGGDTSWYPPIKANKRCTQKQIDGKWLNHGEYKEWSTAGQVLLEGQFVKGKKEGLWIQYDESGKKVAQKWFENGVETTPPAPGSGEPARKEPVGFSKLKPTDLDPAPQPSRRSSPDSGRSLRNR